MPTEQSDNFLKIKMGKKNVSLIVTILFFGFLFFAADSARAGCVSSASVCAGSGGTVDTDPGIEKTCASEGEVWCDPKPETLPIDSPTVKKAIGEVCAGSSECPTGAQCIASGGIFTCQLNGSTPTAPTAPATQTPSGTASDGWSLDSVSGFGLPNSSIMGIVSGILVWLLGALGLLGVIGFVISGILYLTSTGDETMIERAKNAMTWSIVGVVVGLLGVVIIQAIDWMLRGFSNF